jgi:16S rRNA processing protein RimM
LAQEDEYYDTQLIGLEAQLEDGTLLGTIGDVLHLPGGDVLAVERPTRLRGKDAELLVPFVKAIVPVVDLEAGHVVVDPPPGLLELSETPPEPLEP